MRNPWKVTSFALVAVLAAVIGNTAINSADAEPQPKMKSALGHLQSALSELRGATTDKGGHRVIAIDHVNKAIDQVKKGIAYDNKTPRR
jgi:hypothetical protein